MNMIDRKTSLSNLSTEFLAALEGERRASPHTLRNYRAALDRFEEFLTGHLGGRPTLESLAALKPADFRAFLARRHAEGVSAATLALDLSALKSFFKRLAKTRGLSAAAISAVRAPRVEKPLPRPVATEDALKLAATDVDATWTQKRDRALFALLYGCGLRISEAVGLNESAAPLGEALRIRGKGGKDREVPVLPIVSALIEDYRAERPFAPSPADGPLFMGVRGGRLGARAAQKAMEKERGRLGLPETATPHALRHAFATDLLAAGGDLRAVQELLGHGSLEATQRYTKIEVERLVTAHRAAHPRGR